MSSRQKRKQARLNGAKAAGTKSPAGIERSSKNAIKHGLAGKSLVLSNESQAKFDELHQGYVQEFAPQTCVERDLVDDMVACRWRLKRIRVLQTAAIDLQMDRMDAELEKTFERIDQPTRTVTAVAELANTEKTLDLLHRYEVSYSRMYQRALNTLLRLRLDNGIEETPEEPLTSQELRNDPAAPAADAVSTPYITQESQEFAEMITHMSPEELIRYLAEVKSSCDLVEPGAESTE
jgi:hypothetical protein